MFQSIELYPKEAHPELKPGKKSQQNDLNRIYKYFNEFMQPFA
jgi:hypothetical protein